MKTLVRAVAPLLALLALAIGAPAVGAADPTTVIVNSSADTSGGACETSGTGVCTLREAVTYASAGLGGEGVRIEFAASLPGPVLLGGSAIPVAPSGGGVHSLAIVGPGAAQLTIDAQGNSPIFEVGSGAVTIAKLTLSNGGGIDGGAIKEAGSTEDLTLEEVVLSGNEAMRGGAIYQDEGNLRLSHTTLSSNSASDKGGAIYVDTSASKLLELDQVTIDHNEAEEGAGVYVDAGSFKASGGEIAENTASGEGGGIAFEAEAGEQVLEGTWIHGNKAREGGGLSHGANEAEPVIRGAWIEGNEAMEAGGGIYSEESLALERSTVSKNHSLNGEGGGIATTKEISVTDSTIALNEGGAVKNFSNETVNLNGATVVGNQADSGAGRPAAEAGALVGNFTLTSTILYGNEGGNGECEGHLITLGYNVTGTLPTGCEWNLGGIEAEPEHLAGQGDQLGVDPELGELEDHGGPAPTIGPISHLSPIINHGTGPASTTDERYLPRPVPTGPVYTDVGAFELQAPTLVTPPSISPTANLREGDTITCHEGGWDTDTVEDAVVHYTWLVDGNVVAEGSPTYQLVDGDEEKPITCKVVVDDGATSGEATTAAVEFEAGRAGLWPAGSAFGDRELGSGVSAPLTLTLRNEGGSAIDVESVSSGDAQFPIEAQACLGGTALAPGATCAIEARFAPTALGAQEATVTAHTSGGTVTATLTGTGTEAAPKPKPEPEPKPNPDPTPTPGPTAQPSPAPGGESTPTAPAKLQLLSVSRGARSLVLTVRCSAGTGGCRGTATVAAGHGGTILAKGPLAVKAGKATEKLPLTAAGRRLLAADKPLTVVAHAVVHEPGSTVKTPVSAHLTLS